MSSSAFFQSTWNAPVVVRSPNPDAIDIRLWCLDSNYNSDRIAHTLIELGAGCQCTTDRETVAKIVTAEPANSQGACFVFLDQFASGLNLDCFDDLAVLEKRLREQSVTKLVAVGVLSHLRHPKRFLRTIRRFLKANDDNRLIISNSVSRDVSSYTPAAAHFREWHDDSFYALLRSAGFFVSRYEVPYRIKTVNPLPSLFVLSCPVDHYRQFLQQQGLPRASRWLTFGMDGGLQSQGRMVAHYLRHAIRSGVEPPVIILLDRDLHSEFDGELRPYCIQSAAFFPDLNPGKANIGGIEKLPELAYRAVQQVLFYYDEATLIEYPDCFGVGLRIAQARKSGQLPHGVTTRVYCHGGALIEERAQARWKGLGELGSLIAEKNSIELADSICVSDSASAELYRSTGVELPDDRLVHLPFPFLFDAPGTEVDFHPITDIAFVGQPSGREGFGIFFEAVVALLTESANECPLTTLRVFELGPFGDHGRKVKLQEALQTHLEVHVETTSFEDVWDCISACSSSTLFVLGTSAALHPVSLLEFVHHNCRVIGCVTESTRAALPQSLRSVLPTAHQAEQLRELIRQKISEPLDLQIERQRSLRTVCLTQQVNNNKQFSVGLEACIRHDFPVIEIAEPLDATVIVPVYNSSFAHILELIEGLHNQTRRPNKILFVDDCSEPGYREKLSSLLDEHLRLPFSLLTHDTNKGVAGARNTGLAASHSEFVISHDADNILLNHCIEDGVTALIKNQELWGVAFYMQEFRDGEDWRELSLENRIGTPLGQDTILGQTNNIFSDALCMYRREKLVQIGGWDATDTSMWEDWALGLAVTSAGGKLGILPKVSYLYRKRRNSMVRTGNTFDAQLRLARSVNRLSRFEAMRLQGIISWFQKERLELRNQIEKLGTGRKDTP